MTLIKTISSMPKFKMEKLYEVKKDTVRNILNLK
jgi:hypothetical protein